MSKDDWVYNKSEETYHWDARVSGSGDVKDGNYEYVGKGLNDVRAHYKENHPVKDFFGSILVLDKTLHLMGESLRK
ncbi:MAG: hypothetical protein Q4G18_03595 [Myroides sp.]|nr:hypothetical protein [Myroides sp.]